MNFLHYKIELEQKGFSITPKIYNDNEIVKIIALLENIESNSQSIIKTKELFAIRQLINVEPKLWKILLNENLKGIIRTDSGCVKVEDEIICKIKKGECMLMKPLTLHASSRTKNEMQRRVIHLEFSNMKLKKPLDWKEFRTV